MEDLLASVFQVVLIYFGKIQRSQGNQGAYLGLIDSGDHADHADLPRDESLYKGHFALQVHH